MMSPESIFNYLNILTGIAWFFILVLSRYWAFADKIVTGIVVVIISGIYTWLNFSHIGEVGGPTQFLSFDGVMRIFSNPYLIMAGWAHIVAFDILVGIWIKNTAAQNGIPYWVVVPILLVTIMFAPLGFLIFWLARWVATNHYFLSENRQP